MKIKLYYLAFLSLCFCLNIIECAHAQLNETKKHIVLIRDYHCHFQTQIKISEILQELNTEMEMPVFIEGAYGPIILSEFAEYPDKNAVQSVANELLRAGLFSGAEYYAALHNTSHLLHGIDDRTYYLQSYNIFHEIISQRNETMLWLQYLSEMTTALKHKHFSEKLNSIDQLSTDFHAGRIKLDEYLSHIESTLQNKIDWRAYPQLNNFRKLAQKVSQILPDTLEQQQMYFIETCKAQLPEDEFIRLKNIMMHSMIGKITSTDYDSHIRHIIEKYSIDTLPYEDYLDSLTIQAALAATTRSVDRELERFTTDAYKQTAVTHAQRTVIDLIFVYRYVHNLSNFAIPSYKLDTYQSFFERINYDNIYNLLAAESDEALTFNALSNLKSTIDKTLHFYTLSEKRDHLMAEYIDAAMIQLDSNRAAVTCGAMHIDNLAQLLRQKEYSVTIRTPVVTTRLDDINNTVYIERMMGAPFLIGNMMISPSHLAFASLFAREPFLEKLAFSNLQVPISRAVKVALVASSFKNFAQLSTKKIDIASDFMKKVDTILRYPINDNHFDRFEIQDVTQSETGDLLSFEVALIDLTGKKHPHRIRVTFTSNVELAQYQDFMIFPNRDNIMHFKQEFIASFNGPKSHFDEFLKMAIHNPDKIGTALFGDTYMLLNSILGTTMERFHHIAHVSRRDDYVMPFMHAIDVTRNININGVPPKYHRVMRLAALMHNMWRIYTKQEHFEIERTGTAPTVRIFIPSEDGSQQFEIISGTFGEISAYLIPAVLADMDIQLEEWEQKLLKKLVETSDGFGVIDYEWDAAAAREKMLSAAQYADVEFPEYLDLARRLYEADILTIYTSSLSGEPYKGVEKLLDITSKVDEMLRKEKEIGAVPAKVSAKMLFFNSLSMHGPDFMRFVTRAMADNNYAEQIFPPTFLALRNIPDSATPSIHKDTETSRTINPFIHSLNAANLINIEDITNIRALRIAILLHDLGKQQFESFQSDGYEYHAERSAEMIDDTLSEWGIAELLSAEEVILIKFLVKNHDMLNRHTQSKTQWTFNIPRIIQEITPPDELQAVGFSFFTALKYIRRINQADADSVPQLNGKISFNTFETLFGAKYLQEHQKLWDELSEKYSPHLHIRESRYATDTVLSRLQGNAKDYRFQDTSDDITRPFIPSPAQGKTELNQLSLQLLESSL